MVCRRPGKPIRNLLRLSSTVVAFETVLSLTDVALTQLFCLSFLCPTQETRVDVSGYVTACNILR